MAQGMRKYVEAIPGRPLPHGILGGCADVRDVDDIHELLGVEWLGLGCAPVRDWVDPCLNDESPGEESPGAPQQKIFDRPNSEHAEPINVYAGAECSTLGWTYEEARAHAEASLALGEQQAVEAAFWRDRLAVEGQPVADGDEDVAELWGPAQVLDLRLVVRADEVLGRVADDPRSL